MLKPKETRDPDPVDLEGRDPDERLLDPDFDGPDNLETFLPRRLEGRDNADI